MNEQRNKQLVKNTVILTVGKICTQFVSFFLLPLYTSILAPGDYGTVDLLSTYVSLLLPLVNWQLDQGIFRFLIEARSDERREKIVISTAFFTNLLQAAAYLLIIFLIYAIWRYEYLWFLIINVVLNIFSSLFMQTARGIGRMTDYAISSFLSAVGTVSLNVLFLVALHLGIKGMMYSLICAQIITVLYLSIRLNIIHYISLKYYSKQCFKELISYSVPLIPNSLSWWVMGGSDRTVISAVLGTYFNGLYSVANKFSTIFITFYNFFNMSWTETVTLHIYDEDGEQYLKTTINSLFSLFASLCIGLIACMPFVYPIFINQQYADGYYQVPILMLAVLCQVLVGLYSAIYVAQKKSKEIAKTSIMSAIINLVVNVALIHWIGLYAASFSTFVAYASMAVYRYHDIKKYIDARLDKKLILKTIFLSAFVLFTYYLRHPILQCIALFITIIDAVLSNKKILLSALQMAIQKIKH